MPEKEFRLGVEYDDLFVDEATISLLRELKEKEKKYLLIECIDDQCPEKDMMHDISKEQAIKWVLEKYTNKKSTNEEIKEEKMYMLYLMGVSVTKIGEYFGVSRQTVHKKIKKFEN